MRVGRKLFKDCTCLECLKFPSISTRLKNIIQDGNWISIKNKIDSISHIERSGREVFISLKPIVEGRFHWRKTVKQRLDQIASIIAYYEMKEATSLFELALWKSNLNQAGVTNCNSRLSYRNEVPGPVKDSILQYLSFSDKIPGLRCYYERKS